MNNHLDRDALAERWGGFVAVFTHTPDEWSVLLENPRYIRVVCPIEESKTIEELNGAIHRVSDEDCNALTSPFLDTLRFAFARRAKNGAFLKEDPYWSLCPLARLFCVRHRPTIHFCLDRWTNISDEEEACFHAHITSAVEDLISLKDVQSLVLMMEVLGPRKHSCVHLFMTLLHEAVRYNFEPLLQELKPCLRRFTQSELRLDTVLRNALHRAAESTIVALLRSSDLPEHFSLSLVHGVLQSEIDQLVAEDRLDITVRALLEHDLKWLVPIIDVAARRALLG